MMMQMIDDLRKVYQLFSKMSKKKIYKLIITFMRTNQGFKNEFHFFIILRNWRLYSFLDGLNCDTQWMVRMKDYRHQIIHGRKESITKVHIRLSSVKKNWSTITVCHCKCKKKKKRLLSIAWIDSTSYAWWKTVTKCILSFQLQFSLLR